jgi:hypothetical protein
MSNEPRSVQLPADLCAAAEEKFGQRFGSLEALITFVLKELLRDDAARLDEAEQKVVEERLRDLGYI